MGNYPSQLYYQARMDDDMVSLQYQLIGASRISRNVQRMLPFNTSHWWCVQVASGQSHESCGQLLGDKSAVTHRRQNILARDGIFKLPSSDKKGMCLECLVGSTPLYFASYAQKSQRWPILASSRSLLTSSDKRGILMLIGISLKPQPRPWQTH